MKPPTSASNAFPVCAESSHRRVWLVDTTLRDGAQAPGVFFTQVQRLQIAEALAAIGVDEIEVGCPVMGSAEREAIRHIASLPLGCRLTAWCRACDVDLEAAASCDLQVVHLAVPTSDILLSALNKNWPEVLETLAELVRRARRLFDYVSVGAMDASRTDAYRILGLAELCDAMGAQRLRLADSVGILNPISMSRLISDVIAATSRLEIGVHAHNDLGMAVANSLVAFAAGASTADVTILGLGERAGNAPLEELVMALQESTELRCLVDTECLCDLCQLVAGCVERPIHLQKPIVGRNVFRHESGIHVRGMLRDSRSFEPFCPESIGRQHRYLELGTHSGRAGLMAALGTEGIRPEVELVGRVLQQVRELAGRSRRPVSSREAALIYRQLKQGEVVGSDHSRDTESGKQDIASSLT